MRRACAVHRLGAENVPQIPSEHGCGRVAAGTQELLLSSRLVREAVAEHPICEPQVRLAMEAKV